MLIHLNNHSRIVITHHHHKPQHHRIWPQQQRSIRISRAAASAAAGDAVAAAAAHALPLPPVPNNDAAVAAATKLIARAPAVAAAPLPEALLQTFGPAVFASPTAARRACRRGAVRVDGQRGACGTAVAAGQLLEVLEAAAAAAAAAQRPAEAGAGQQRGQRQRGLRPPPRGVDVRVVYEDDFIAVVVKPPGLSTHSPHGRRAGHHLAAYCGWLLAPSTQPDALPGGPAPAHRLDRLTGGLVAFAKTRSAAAVLTAQFEVRAVRKRYRAVVAGRLNAPPPAVAPSAGGGTDPAAADTAAATGTATTVIIVDEPVERRDAVTEVLVRGHARCLRYGGWLTDLELRPRTGRRHQLRRHLALCLGRPIIGDSLYTPWAADPPLAPKSAELAALLAAPPSAFAAGTPGQPFLLAAAGSGGNDDDDDEDEGDDGSDADGKSSSSSSTGSSSSSSNNSSPPGTFELLRGRGMALWAASLEFAHPVTGVVCAYDAPPPRSRFDKLLAEQDARWRKFYETV